MMIGALGVTAYYMYMDKNSMLACKMKKLKKAGMNAANKVKTMF